MGIFILGLHLGDVVFRKYIQVLLKVVQHRATEHTHGSPASLLQASPQELLIMVELCRTTGQALENPASLL